MQVIFQRAGGGDMLARSGRYLRMANTVEKLILAHPLYEEHKYKGGGHSDDDSSRTSVLKVFFPTVIRTPTPGSTGNHGNYSLRFDGKGSNLLPVDAGLRILNQWRKTGYFDRHYAFGKESAVNPELIHVLSEDEEQDEENGNTFTKREEEVIKTVIKEEVEQETGRPHSLTLNSRFVFGLPLKGYDSPYSKRTQQVGKLNKVMGKLERYDQAPSV